MPTFGPGSGEYFARIVRAENKAVDMLAKLKRKRKESPLLAQLKERVRGLS
jgi:hypothetical protein